MQPNIKKTLAFIVVAVAVGLITYFIFDLFTSTCCAPPPEDRAFANAKAICEAENGFFIEALEICQLPATDSGKICRDSSECEGLCVAKPTPAEIADIAAGVPVNTPGACSQWKNFFSGCFYVVEDGAAERLCAD